jgi:hypothetical protein
MKRHGKAIYDQVQVSRIQYFIHYTIKRFP